jgi:RNA polymerase sigma-70 factor, ECF subfamily
MDIQASRRESLFNHIVRLIEPTVRRTLHKYLPNRQDADDTVQEVLIRLWKHLYKVPIAESRARAWACTTSKNLALDLIRRRNREARYLDRSYYVDMSSTVDGNDPFRIWQFPSTACPGLGLNLNGEVERAFSTLSSPQRQAILMVAEGYSYKDIASAQNQNVGTVRSRIHYARRQLREQLTE